jgi:two-component system response regulator HydG
MTLDQLESRYIARVLKMLGGNKSRAAQVMGLDRRTLYRKLERQTGVPGAEPSSEDSPAA